MLFDKILSYGDLGQYNGGFLSILHILYGSSYSLLIIIISTAFYGDMDIKMGHFNFRADFKISFLHCVDIFYIKFRKKILVQVLFCVKDV